MNNISKTIMESLEMFDLQWGIAPPESLKGKKGKYFKSHLLQSQIRLIEAWIGELKKKDVEPATGKPAVFNYEKEWYTGYNQSLEDQISSLNETLKFIKKSL